MRFVTIASTLLGATLAAPAPQPDDGKTLDRRWTHIDVTDISLQAMNGRLESASIKLNWDGTERWCFHKGSKHGCHDINNNDRGDFNFHMEDQDLPAHGYTPKFWVSRRLWLSDQEEVASVDMGKITCGRDQKCTPEHNPAWITTPPTAPGPWKRATPPDGQTVTISDIEIHTNLNEIFKASVKLQWGSDTVWCSHRPKKPLECSDINHNYTDDFKFHVETNDAVKAGANLTFFVSHKDEVKSIPVHVQSCSGFSTKSCELDQNKYIV